MYENLKDGLSKIIGGTVETAFELKDSRGLFMTIKTEDKPMALVIEESSNGSGGYGEEETKKTEIYVIESLV